MKWATVFFCFFSLPVFSQEQIETRELIGQLGGRTALVNLYTTERPDGSARVTGDYILLPSLQQRFVDADYFELVSVAPALDEKKDGRVPIDVLLEMGRVLGIAVVILDRPQG